MQSNTVRDAATWVARRLHEEGHVAYFAGGCVRDRLLGLEPADYDVATDARPERVQELFRGAMSVGESFGVILVRRDGVIVEVATFRSDGPYLDGRHPEGVTFADEQADSARRDFTINAIFEHPETGMLVDYHNGEADIAAQILRAVGDPAQRFAEDHLRILRAVRFAAALGFEIESETESALQEAASSLSGVSRERVGGELRRMLAAPTRVRAVSLLEAFALDSTILGSPPSQTGKHVALSTLGSTERSPVEGLAAWMLDRSECVPLQAADQVREMLLLSNQEHRMLQSILDVVARIESSWETLGIAGRKRLASAEAFPVGLEFVRAREEKLGQDVEREVAVLAETELAPDPLIDGDMLISAGLQPGVQFGRILEAVYDAQLEGKVTQSEDALALALRIAELSE